MSPHIPSALKTLFRLQSYALLIGWSAVVLGIFWTALLWIGIVVLALMSGLYIYVAFLGAQYNTAGDTFRLSDFFHLRGALKLLRQTRTAFAAWTHLLTFDLAIGLGIAYHAGQNAMPVALTLLALAMTLMFGPAGMLLYAVGVLLLS